VQTRRTGWLVTKPTSTERRRSNKSNTKALTLYKMNFQSIKGQRGDPGVPQGWERGKRDQVSGHAKKGRTLMEGLTDI